MGVLCQAAGECKLERRSSGEGRLSEIAITTPAKLAAFLRKFGEVRKGVAEPRSCRRFYLKSDPFESVATAAEVTF